MLETKAFSPCREACLTDAAAESLRARLRRRRAAAASRPRLLSLLVALGLLLFATGALRAAETRIYVDGSVSSSGDGTSWAQAYKTLEEGLTAAGTEIGDGATDVRLWVASASGYTPGESTERTPGTARTRTFSIPDGVKLYGGFSGAETALSQRPSGQRTTLSGHIGYAESDRAYHVVFAEGDCTLDRFVITESLADGESDNAVGGGLFAETGALVLTDCRFVENGGSTGAALYAGGTVSSLSMTACIFEDNHVSTVVVLSGDVTAERCRFVKNAPPLADDPFKETVALESGGTHAIRRCAFDRNESVALFLQGGTSTVENCVFSGNIGDEKGGAIRIDGGTATIAFCTIAFNAVSSTGSGAGLYAAGSATVTLDSTILWENYLYVASFGEYYADSFDQIQAGSATLTLSHCCVKDADYGGGTDSGGNISSNPRFSSPSDPDGGDGILGSGNDGLRLAYGSPCLDAGDDDSAPAADILGVTRPKGDGVEIGAYECEVFNFIIEPSTFYGKLGKEMTIEVQSDVDLVSKPTVKVQLPTETGYVWWEDPETEDISSSGTEETANRVWSYTFTPGTDLYTGVATILVSAESVSYVALGQTRIVLDDKDPEHHTINTNETLELWLYEPRDDYWYYDDIALVRVLPAEAAVDGDLTYNRVWYWDDGDGYTEERTFETDQGGAAIIDDLYFGWYTDNNYLHRITIEVGEEELEYGWGADQGGTTGVANGMVIYYPFDQDTKDYSGSEKAFDGIMAGTIFTEDRFANEEMAMDFRGEGGSTAAPNGLYAEVDRTLSMDDLTIAFWLQLHPDDRSQITVMDVRKGLDEGIGTGKLPYYELTLDGTTSQRRLYLRSLDPENDWLDYDKAGWLLPADGTWHHLAVVVRGDRIMFYLDGSSAEDDWWYYHDGFRLFEEAVLRLAYAGPGDARFPGQLDDFRIYSRALMSSEVKDLASGAYLKPIFFLEPRGNNDKTDMSYDITWALGPNADKGTLTLLYGTEEIYSGGAGTSFASGVDPDDRMYRWDCDDVPNGEYYIYGTHSHENKTAVSLGRLIIKHPPPPVYQPDGTVNDPPSIWIDPLADEAEATSGTLTLTGGVSDDGVVTRVVVNGVRAVRTDTNYATWEAMIPLHLGSNTVEAVATDGSGGRGTTMLYLRLSDDGEVEREASPGDDEPPDDPGVLRLSIDTNRSRYSQGDFLNMTIGVPEIPNADARAAGESEPVYDAYVAIFLPRNQGYVCLDGFQSVGPLDTVRPLVRGFPLRTMQPVDVLGFTLGPGMPDGMYRAYFLLLPTGESPLETEAAYVVETDFLFESGF